MHMILTTPDEIERQPTPTHMIDVAERFLRIGTAMPDIKVRRAEGKLYPLHAVDSAILEAVRRVDPTIKLPVLPVD